MCFVRSQNKARIAGKTRAFYYIPHNIRVVLHAARLLPFGVHHVSRSPGALQARRALGRQGLKTCGAS